jgi:hypothetical protein
MTPLDYRRFILDAYHTTGQDVAALAGCAVPDEQVRMLEDIDVLKRWVTLQGAGVSSVLQENALLMTRLNQQQSWTQDDVLNTYKTFFRFAMATVLRLREEGLIQLAHEPILVTTITDPDTGVETAMDPLNYSYKDEIGHLDFTPQGSYE